MLPTFITNSAVLLLFLFSVQIFGGKNKLINIIFYENRISKKQNSDIIKIGNEKEKFQGDDKKSNRYTYCCELEKKTLKNNPKVKKNAVNLSVYNIKSQELFSYDKIQQSLVGAILCNNTERLLEILDTFDDEYFNFSNSYQTAKSFGSYDIVIPRPEVRKSEGENKDDEKSDLDDENNEDKENKIEDEKNIEKEREIFDEKNYPKAVCINEEIVNLPHLEKQLLEVAYPQNESCPTVFTIGTMVSTEHWLVKQPDLDLILYSIISVHPEVLAVLLEKNYWSLTYKNIDTYVKACQQLAKDLKNSKKKDEETVNGVMAIKKLITDKAKEIKISAKDKKFIFQESLKIAKFVIE